MVISTEIPVSKKNKNLKFIGIFCEEKPTFESNTNLFFDISDIEQFGSYTHVKEFLDLPSKKINNKRLLEWFFAFDISLWWFIAPSIHSKFKEGALFINRFSNFLENQNFTILIMNGNFDKKDLVQQICKNNNIQFKVSKLHFFSFKIKNLLKSFSKKLRYRHLTNKKIKKRVNINKFEVFNQLKDDYVLITSPGIYRRSTFDLKNGGIKKEEFFIKDFLEFFNNKNIQLLCIDLDYTLRGSTKILNERLKSKFKWIPVELFFSNHPRSSDINNKLGYIKNSIKELKRVEPLESFEYNNVSLWNFLVSTFDEMLLEPNLPTYLNLIECLESSFKNNRPKLIVQTYEAGPYAKAFEFIAKKMKIKTISIQHGLIPSDYPDYMFKEIKNNDSFGNLIPDTTLVYGKYYKDLLTNNGSYPKNTVSIFGHPTYFHFNKMMKSITINDLKKKFSFENKKIILVPLSFRLTSIHNNSDKILLDRLFQIFKESQNIIILIRPHPGDLKSENIINRLYPSKNFQVSKNSLVEDFLISDVVTIIIGSTVATESILFEKPTILIDTCIPKYSSIDPVHLKMIDYGVAELINIDELQIKLNYVFKKISITKNFYKNRDKFLTEFFHTFDSPNFNFLDNKSD